MRKYADEHRRELQQEFPDADPADIEAVVKRERLEWDIFDIESLSDVRSVLDDILSLIPNPKDKLNGR